MEGNHELSQLAKQHALLNIKDILDEAKFNKAITLYLFCEIRKILLENTAATMKYPTILAFAALMLNDGCDCKQIAINKLTGIKLDEIFGSLTGKESLSDLDLYFSDMLNLDKLRHELVQFLRSYSLSESWLFLDNTWVEIVKQIFQLSFYKFIEINSTQTISISGKNLLLKGISLFPINITADGSLVSSDLRLGTVYYKAYMRNDNEQIIGLAGMVQNRNLI